MLQTVSINQCSFSWLLLRERMLHLVKPYETNCDLWIWTIQIKFDWLQCTKYVTQCVTSQMFATSKSPVLRIWKATVKERVEPLLHCPRLLMGDWHTTASSLGSCWWLWAEEKMDGGIGTKWGEGVTSIGRTGHTKLDKENRTLRLTLLWCFIFQARISALGLYASAYP